MKQLLTICDKCKQAIEDAAYESYQNGDNPDRFDGCTALVDLTGDAQIEATVDRKGNYEVNVYHDSGNETPNFEKFLTDWLTAHADPEGQWQDAYDSDDWRDVDPGCDPAFPHYGDFERWAYGWR